jgi:hypothetical protein
MIVRVAFGAVLTIAAAGNSGTLAQSRDASDALLGRWDLVVQRDTEPSPSWLEVERSATSQSPRHHVRGTARGRSHHRFDDDG